MIYFVDDIQGESVKLLLVKYGILWKELGVGDTSIISTLQAKRQLREMETME